MKYKVIATMKINDNTAVLIEGDGRGLQNNMIVETEKGNQYKLLSVGMIDFKNKENIGSASSILIEGKFEGDYIQLWDPDFTKLTQQEAKELKEIIAEVESGEWVSEEDVWGKQEEHLLVCPMRRKEVLIKCNIKLDDEVLCSICNRSHRLPDGVRHTMEELRTMNMFDFSW